MFRLNSTLLRDVHMFKLLKVLQLVYYIGTLKQLKYDRSFLVPSLYGTDKCLEKNDGYVMFKFCIAVFMSGKVSS
jgi:hypothetical protein